MGNPAAPKGKRRRCCIAELEVALVEQQKQKNGKYFVDHFAVAFKPKEEIKNNTVKVITESDPEAIFKASETNTTMSLTIALAEHDCNFCQGSSSSIHNRPWSMSRNYMVELFP